MDDQHPNTEFPPASPPTDAPAAPVDEVAQGAEPAPRSRHRRKVVIAVVAGALVLGGGAVAFAATGTGPGNGPAAGYGYHPGGGYGPPGSGTGTGTPPAHEPHIGGTVTSVTGGTIVVTDFDGFSRTIKTTSATTYDDNLTAPLATGTKILATGTVDSDKTSLDATEIHAMPTGGPGGHGFPGGPGRGNGTPPSGAPTPPSGAPSGTPSASPTSS